MQENDKSQKGQELLDVDDKGKIVEPKKIIKKPENKETFTHVLLIFLALVWSFSQNFYFQQKHSKSK